MPDVISNQPADVRLWVSLDVHKLSIVAATLPLVGGQPEVCQIETTRVAIRRFDGSAPGEVASRCMIEAAVSAAGPITTLSLPVMI
jgi:hypothetical protein